MGLSVDGVLILEDNPKIIIPLININYYQYAVSHETLEYRSIGAEFLAQQKGGHFGLRIDMQIPDPFAVPFTILFEKMTALSRPYRDFDKNVKFGTAKATSTEAVGRGRPGSTPSRYTKAEGGWVYRGKGGAFPKGTTTSLANFANPEYILMKLRKELAGYRIRMLDDESFDMDSLRNTWRRTCTLMTPDSVVFGIYVETIRYERKEINGKDIAVIQLLFREFKPEDARVEEIKYFKEPRAYYEDKDKLKGVFTESEGIAFKVKSYYSRRNKVILRTKKTLKKMAIKHIASMMGIASSDIKLVLTTEGDIIDVPELYNFLFDYIVKTSRFFTGRDKGVIVKRIGGYVM